VMSDETEAPQEKKIVVDEDWKAQVQAEQEAAEPPEPARAGRAAGPIPPPSLELLASTLAMQAMVCLGLVPNPVTGKAEFHPEQAKHFIDTIQMLRDKTEGNRTADETATFDHLLYELRLGYVAVQEKRKTEGAG